MPLVYDAMKRAMDETGEAKIFSMNITADDHFEMCARADFALECFGPDADKVAFLVDGSFIHTSSSFRCPMTLSA